MIAWKKYQESEDFANSKKWAAFPDHREGSLWGAFSEGFRVATERAALLHESINPASDDERLNHVPGAGAMGAIIQYRDAIRAIGFVEREVA